MIKQRIARPNDGKSGGFRSIVLFKAGNRSFFVYGFPKNMRDNVRRDELQGFKELASEMLPYDDEALTNAIKVGALIEVKCHDDND